MWGQVKDRLDRRWKRIAFILWAPLFVVTILVSAYALFHVYIVNFAYDPYVFGCHQKVLGVVWKGLSGPEKFEIPENFELARKRSQSRLSSDTREVQRSPAFMSCMSQSDNRDYWLNYTFILQGAAASIFWTALFALIIFPRFWRGMGRAIGYWITMKT
jgi:hypothetical protein